MDPTINFLETDDDEYLRFNLSNTNVSLANAIRRTILSDIPIIVFRTTPYEKNNATIHVNTTRMNNEIIKQRLSCVPIHISDIRFPIEKFQLEIDKSNVTDTMQYVTTQDFKIKDTTTGVFLSESDMRQIFPPDTITDDYIEFVRLRPRISDEIAGEHLKLSCKFAFGTAEEDSAFNITSTCAYAATPDEKKQDEAWALKEKTLKEKTLTDEELAFEKKNWHLLDAKRIFIPDSFDFVIKTIGQLSNKNIIFRACDIIIHRLEKLKQKIKNDYESLIEVSATTIENGFDILLHHEGYTIGTMIEYILYASYYEKQIFTYCGFQKPHPHIDLCKIRIGLKEAVPDKNIVATYILNAADAAIKVYEKIGENFKD